MAETPKTGVRLSPILMSYLDDLAKLGAYGRGKSGVMRRFIEDGVQRALEKGVIERRSVADFGEESDDDED